MYPITVSLLNELHFIILCLATFDSGPSFLISLVVIFMVDFYILRLLTLNLETSRRHQAINGVRFCIFGLWAVFSCQSLCQTWHDNFECFDVRWQLIGDLGDRCDVAFRVSIGVRELGTEVFVVLCHACTISCSSICHGSCLLRNDRLGLVRA